MTWQSSMRAFVGAGMGIAPDLAPALLGLRLLSDLSLGKEPFQHHAPLHWAPVLGATPALQLSGDFPALCATGVYTIPTICAALFRTPCRDALFGSSQNSDASRWKDWVCGQNRGCHRQTFLLLSLQRTAATR